HSLMLLVVLWGSLLTAHTHTHTHTHTHSHFFYLHFKTLHTTFPLSEWLQCTIHRRFFDIQSSSALVFGGHVGHTHTHTHFYSHTHMVVQPFCGNEWKL